MRILKSQALKKAVYHFFGALVYIISILNYNLKHEDVSLWDKDNFIARYRMVEERTGELAPPTIFVNFAEVKRFTKTLSRACEIAWLPLIMFYPASS